MSKKIEISVLVPIYNTEKYIKRCVESILAQTYEHFEILLIDDGSKDDSGHLCDEFATKDRRIRVIHKENSGVSATRNIGIQEAKGEYVAFVDSDDYIRSNMLEKMILRAKENNSDVVMCNYFVDKKGKITQAQMQYNHDYNGYEQIKKGLLYLYYTDYHNGLYSLWNKLIKKSIYVDHNISFDTSLNRGEDAWFVFECLKYCKRVDYISESFYYYYQNENSIMHSIYEKQYEQWVKIRKRLLNENKILKFEISYDLFYREFIYKTALYCRDLAKYNRVGKIKEILSDPFYINAAQYASRLPKHTIFLTKCAKYRMTIIPTIMYILWARL